MNSTTAKGSLRGVVLLDELEASDKRGGGNEQLVIGDMVLIAMVGADNRLSGVVDADGFFTNAVQPLDTSMKASVSDALFRICPALQYDAQSEFNKLGRRKSFSLQRSKSIGSMNEMKNIKAQVSDVIALVGERSVSDVAARVGEGVESHPTRPPPLHQPTNPLPPPHRFTTFHPSSVRG